MPSREKRLFFWRVEMCSSVLKSFRLSAEVLRYHAAFLTSVNWFPGLEVSRHLTEVHDSN